MTTRKKVEQEEPKPAAAAPPPPPDPTRCICTGVQRRYDGDGLIEAHTDRPNDYRCAKCGKAYS